MGQGSSQLLTHTWIMKMAQKPWYIIEKGMKSGRRGKTGKEKGGGRNTTVKRKNSILLIILLGHDRGRLLYWCMCNSFPLTLSTNIFSLDLD